MATKLSVTTLIDNHGIGLTGLDEEGESEMEDDEEADTIEIRCGPSPDIILKNEDEEELSNNNVIISEQTKIDNTDFPLKLELDV